MPTRVKLGFLISPLTVVPVLAAAGAILGIGDDEQLRAMSSLAAEGGLIAALWGVPVAYVVTMLIGPPAYYVMRARNAVRRRLVYTICAVAGALTMTLINAVLTSSPPRWEPALTGAILGVLHAGVFVLVAGRHLVPANARNAS